MCVVTRDSDSRSLINDDSILKYCNPFWDIIGWCRGNEPGNFFGYFTHPVIVLFKFLYFVFILVCHGRPDFLGTNTPTTQGIPTKPTTLSPVSTTRAAGKGT